MSTLKVLVEAILIQKSLNNIIDFRWIGVYLKDSKIDSSEITYEDEEFPALIYAVLKSIDIKAFLIKCLTRRS